MSPRRQLLADLLLVLVCFFWGSTFVLVKEAVAAVPVAAFLAIRFTLAALLLALLFARRLGRVDRRTLASGLALGGVLFAAYALQTYGLARTSAANAGFITGLSVVLVPLFAAAAFGVRPGTGALAGAALAAAGLFLLSTGGRGIGGPFNAGDLLVLGCAVGFAWHILLTGRFARAFDPTLIATIQVATTALLAAAAAWLVGDGIPRSLPPVVWRAILLTALFATVFAFLAQTVAQRYTSATRTALIFALEPVFAALVAWGYAGEPLTRWTLVGGSLVVLGMLCAAVGPEGPEGSG